MDTPRWAEAEAYLTRHNVRWTGPIKVPLSLIDERASFANQSRAEAIDPEHLETFVQAIKQGDQLPPVIGVRRGKKVWLADGNHRENAARKAKVDDFVWAYILAPDTSSEMIALITACINVLNGKPVSTKWRGRNALWLLELGFTQAQAAVELRISPGIIGQVVRLDKADKRAADLGLTSFHKLVDSAREQLARITSDAVFIAATITVAETEFGAGEALRRFVSSLTTAPSEEAALKKVNDVKAARIADHQRQLITNRKPGRTSVPIPKMRLATALGAVEAIDIPKIVQGTIMEAEKDEWRRRVSSAVVHLLELEDALTNGSD
jgi:ParB-like chromosome segregation protein Spo0J